MVVLAFLMIGCSGGHKDSPASTGTAGETPVAAAASVSGRTPAGAPVTGTVVEGASGPGRSPITPLPTAAATPKPSANSAETVQKYVEFWQQQQYGAMYDLLSGAARQSISRDKFVARYEGIADEASITAIAPAFTPPADKQADQVPLSVTYTTSLFGDLRQDLLMPLQREADGWRVQWSPSLIFKALGASNLVHKYTDVPQRGAILARDGQPLAITAAVGVVGTSRAIMNNPSAVRDKQATLNALSQRLGISVADIQKKLDDPSISADYFIAIKTLPYNEPPDQRAAIEAIPGAIVQDTPQRVYPLGPTTAHVVGYVAHITAEQLKDLAAQGYGPDDVVGATGLEASFEQQLAGTRGLRLAIITPDGQTVQDLANHPGAPASEVVTTIDVKAQQGAEAAMKAGKQSGSLIMLDPNDNSVIAMVSQPSFDPNLFVQGLTTEQQAQLFDEKQKPLLNRATTATYPPGSTFKVVTAAAGLERGGLTPQSRLPCPPVWYGLGQNLPKANWRPDNLGDITVTDALMTSCNPVFYQIGLNLDRTDPNILPGFASAFGYGRPTGINGLVEGSGLDPNPDWKLKTLKEPWFTGDSVNMAIGQGYVLVTPLQLANAYSGIVRNGDLRSPLLVRELRPAVAGAASQQFQSKQLGQMPVSAATFQVIKDGMTRVVQDPRGTAYSTFQGSRLDAAGKSGTAEDQGLQDHVDFVAFAPRSAPKAVAVVFLDEGKSGSLEAGPIVRRALETYLGQ